MIKQWFGALLIAPFLVTLPLQRIAHAETGPPTVSNDARARELFAEAMVDMDTQKYSYACRKLEQVTELLPKGIGAHEMLGDCYEKLERLGSAWEQYTLAQTLAYAAADPRSETLSAKAKALEPRVTRLMIVVPQELRMTRGLSVLHNGRTQEKSLWDISMPVDKGKHTVEVAASGYLPWKQEINIATDGGNQTIFLPPQLIPIPTPLPPPPRPVRSGTTWLRPMGWTFTSMGVASGVTSGILTGLAYQQQSASNANGHCDENNRCDEQGIVMRDRAIRLVEGATATAIVGGVLAAGGITMLIVAPRKQDEAPRKTTGLTWNVNVTPQGVRLYGTW